MPHPASAHVNALQHSELLQRSDHLPLVNAAAAVSIIAPAGLCTASWELHHSISQRHQHDGMPLCPSGRHWCSLQTCVPNTDATKLQHRHCNRPTCLDCAWT